MYKFFLHFLLSCFSFIGYAQDTLYLTNEHMLIANVSHISFDQVACRRADTLKNKEMYIPRNKIRLIAFGNGTVQVLSVKKLSAKILVDTMFRKGMKDAEVCYKHPGGSIATGLLAFATGGILGLVPATICSATTPKPVNLGLPVNASVRNKAYILGYTYQAKKMKQKKVWGAYAMGVGGAVLLAIITHL